MIIWPKALPGIQATGWNYAQKTNMVVSEMEMGPPKRRNRGTKSYATLKGTLLLSATELNTFIKFVSKTLAYGIKSFVWQDFMTGDPWYAQLSIKKDGDLYSVSEKKQGEFTVTLELELIRELALDEISEYQSLQAQHKEEQHDK